MSAAPVDYLRLSVTGLRNADAAYYGLPEEAGAAAEPLGDAELVRAAAAFARLGVRTLRIAGGEPLLRRGIAGLAGRLRSVPGLQKLALSTNGILLGDLAKPLREAGVDGVSIGLDTLRPAVFRRLCGCDSLEDAWDGVMAALRAGFPEVRVNMVVMRGVNDSEIKEFARLSLDFPLTVRFVELFSGNARAAALKSAFVATPETKRVIEDKYGPLELVPPASPGAHGRLYRRRGAKGRIGFVSGRGDCICGSCARVRMDCAGRIAPCLFSPPTHDLSGLLRGAPDEALDEYLQKVVLAKNGRRSAPPYQAG